MIHKFFSLIILLAIFAFGFLIAKNTLSRIYDDLRSKAVSVSSSVQTPSCDADCQKLISDQVSKAVATISGTTKTLVINNSSAPKIQDSYITIPGSGSTINTGWTDVTGTDFSFDVSRDFGPGAKFSWEGFLRVTDGNGQAFARIYDATNGIGVNGSEVSISSSADYQRFVSTNLSFWNGRNVYRVQIKSLNTYDVDYMGGKIRVSY